MASILARSVRLAATLRPRLLVVQPPGQAMMSKLSKAVLARPVRLNEIADNPGAHTPVRLLILSFFFSFPFFLLTPV